MIIFLDRCVSSLVLLITDHLLGQDLVLVRHFVQFLHKGNIQEVTVHLGLRSVSLQLLHQDLQHLLNVRFILISFES